MLSAAMAPERERSGWRARLELGFEPSGDRTVLAHRLHHGPLAVQRPFHPEADGTCHVYVLHPPGGVAGGDELTLEVDVAPGAAALLTTPAANKLYRSFGRPAHVTQSLRVADGARLEWLPQETIAFEGTDARVTTRVDLSRGARFLGWEVLCLGRPAAGEGFAQGLLASRFEIHRDGEPLFVERGRYAGAGDVLHAAWGLGGATVVGTLVCATPGRDGLVEAARDVATPLAPGRIAVTQLYEATVCRYVGDQAEEARRALSAVWGVLRTELWGVTPCVPRIWLT